MAGQTYQIHASSSLDSWNTIVTTKAAIDITTLSLHDALPISRCLSIGGSRGRSSRAVGEVRAAELPVPSLDRKSTRLNFSHDQISYAGSCLKKTVRALDYCGVSAANMNLQPA